MSDAHDPRRLLEGDAAFAELTEGLRSARGRGPSPEQAARMRAALGLPAGPGIEPPAATAPAPARPVLRSKLLKLIAIAVLASGAALGVLSVRDAENGERPGVPPIATPRVIAPAPALQTRIPAIEQAESERDTSTASDESAKAARAPHTPPRVVRTMPAHAKSVSDPVAELALLKRAKADARSAPAHALALVAEHEQRFPNGVLVEEREVIAIEALLASGARAAGEARATRFLGRFPNSAHARRVRALLGDTSAAQSDTKPPASQHPSH